MRVVCFDGRVAAPHVVEIPLFRCRLRCDACIHVEFVDWFRSFGIFCCAIRHYSESVIFIAPFVFVRQTDGRGSDADESTAQKNALAEEIITKLASVYKSIQLSLWLLSISLINMRFSFHLWLDYTEMFACVVCVCVCLCEFTEAEHLVRIERVPFEWQKNDSFRCSECDQVMIAICGRRPSRSCDSHINRMIKIE